MKKIIGRIIDIVGIVFVVWMGLSYVDILAHNLTDQNFASWNLITMLVKG